MVVWNVAPFALGLLYNMSFLYHLHSWFPTLQGLKGFHIYSPLIPLLSLNPGNSHFCQPLWQRKFVTFLFLFLFAHQLCSHSKITAPTLPSTSPQGDSDVTQEITSAIACPKSKCYWQTPSMSTSTQNGERQRNRTNLKKLNTSWRRERWVKRELIMLLVIMFVLWLYKIFFTSMSSQNSKNKINGWASLKLWNIYWTC